MNDISQLPKTTIEVVNNNCIWGYIPSSINPDFPLTGYARYDSADMIVGKTIVFHGALKLGTGTTKPAAHFHDYPEFIYHMNRRSISGLIKRLQEGTITVSNGHFVGSWKITYVSGMYNLTVV